MEHAISSSTTELDSRLFRLLAADDDDDDDDGDEFNELNVRAATQN